MSANTLDKAEVEAEFKRKFPLTYQAALSGESKAHGDLSNAWWGWEASRQALEVELPLAVCKANGFDCEENEDDESYNLALTHCAIQIRAAGIRIKGDV